MSVCPSEISSQSAKFFSFRVAQAAGKPSSSKVGGMPTRFSFDESHTYYILPVPRGGFLGDSLEVLVELEASSVSLKSE